MPYLKVETNAAVADSERSAALKTLSAHAASILGKSEDYVMARIEFSADMSFAGTTHPCAYCTLASLGLEEASIPEISKALTEKIAELLSLQRDRVYIRFESPERKHFAFKGKPFA